MLFRSYAIFSIFSTIPRASRITASSPFTVSSREFIPVITLLKFSGDMDMRENIFFALSEVKCPILRMQPTNMSLEEVFLKLTNDEGKMRDKEMEGEQ